MGTIITLGSNSNQEENIFKAQALLEQRFEDVKFFDTQRTKSIGIKSDKFLSCIGTFDAVLSPIQVIQCLKKIEQTMGGPRENRQIGKVLIDIDPA